MCRLLLYGQGFAILCISDSAVLLKILHVLHAISSCISIIKFINLFTYFVPLCNAEMSEMLKRGLVTFLLNSCVGNVAIFNCVAVS